MQGKLILLCGKMGAGKSTLSEAMAVEQVAVVISEDSWLAAHFPSQINTFEEYLEYSRRIKPFVKTHCQKLLKAGVTLVMDFPANTVKQRQWLLSLSSEIQCAHELVYINVSDEVCLQQIAKRRLEQPERAKFDTPEMFRAVTEHFEAPSATEGLHIVEHRST